jgi:pimeloyl-ACP methyl ester carboxylesterase
MQQWLADIGMAVSELRDMARVRQVSLVGFRMGGTFACRVASDLEEIGALALWDPIVRGEPYVRGLLDAAGVERGATIRSCTSDGRECSVIGLNGFPFPEEMARDLSEIDLLKLDSFQVERTAIITSDHRQDLSDLASHLSTFSGEVTHTTVTASFEWGSGDRFSSAVIAPEIQEEILAFLRSSSGG